MDWAWFALILISILMIVGAVIDAWKLKVPNWLTFSMILGGWAYWAVMSVAYGSAALIGHSLAGSFVAGSVLFVFWLIGGMGAGDVKMYAGFGAWIVPLKLSYEGLFWSFCISVIVGGVLALLMIVWKGTVFVNIENTKDILRDLQTSKSIGEVSTKARERKSSLTLLPYGVPLTVGSLAYLAYVALNDPSMISVR